MRSRDGVSESQPKNMNRINQLDPVHATGKTKQLFDAAQTKFGAVSNLIRVLGKSPAAFRNALCALRHWQPDCAGARPYQTFPKTA